MDDSIAKREVHLRTQNFVISNIFNLKLKRIIKMNLYQFKMTKKAQQYNLLTNQP
jgi:hypothetical protein